jgi:hypothetical protein
MASGESRFQCLLVNTNISGFGPLDTVLILLGKFNRMGRPDHDNSIGEGDHNRVYEPQKVGLIGTIGDWSGEMWWWEVTSCLLRVTVSDVNKVDTNLRHIRNAILISAHGLALD